MAGELIEKFKIPIGISIIGLILIIGGIISSNLNKSKAEYPKESLVNSEKLMSIDVSGSVKKPGVYKIKDGSRIEDAIQAAGGFSVNANNEYISKYLNLAQKITDGSKIYIPQQGESTNASSSNIAVVAGASTQSKININTSTQSELESLPGIGPVTASKIISGRLYGSADDLLNKKILSKGVYEKIKDSIIIY